MSRTKVFDLRIASQLKCDGLRHRWESQVKRQEWTALALERDKPLKVIHPGIAVPEREGESIVGFAGADHRGEKVFAKVCQTLSLGWLGQSTGDGMIFAHDSASSL